MNAKKLIYQTLAALVAGRVYPVQVPEVAKTTVDGKSYIVYTDVATTPETSQDGYEGHEYVLMQIDVYSPSYAMTDELMEDVMDALNGIHADIGSRQSIPDQNPKLYRQTLDCHVWGTTF